MILMESPSNISFFMFGGTFMRRLRLYSIKDGKKLSCVEGNARTVLSMLTLPGLRESIVMTRLSVIKEVANSITTTGLKTQYGDIIHQAKLEQDCSFQYVVILDDKKKEQNVECQIISICYRNKQFYSLEKETDAKRILFLE